MEITSQHEYLSNSGIGSLETKLNPADFKRVHRSFIVNFNKAIELRKEGRIHFLILENEDEVRVIWRE
jgi:two-component system LytT family response regulator